LTTRETVLAETPTRRATFLRVTRIVAVPKQEKKRQRWSPGLPGTVNANVNVDIII
jgi:hypothetical protein